MTSYVSECALSSTTEYYWYRETLNISPNIETSGGLQVHLLATMILAWFIVALCLIKGIASSGKVNFKSKSNLHYTRGITPKTVTSGGPHLRSLAPGNTAPKKRRSSGDW